MQFNNTNDCGFVKLLTPQEFDISTNETFNVTLQMFNEIGGVPSNLLVLEMALYTEIYYDSYQLLPTGLVSLNTSAPVITPDGVISFIDNYVNHLNNISLIMDTKEFIILLLHLIIQFFTQTQGNFANIKMLLCKSFNS